MLLWGEFIVRRDVRNINSDDNIWLICATTISDSSEEKVIVRAGSRQGVRQDEL